MASPLFITIALLSSALANDKGPQYEVGIKKTDYKWSNSSAVSHQHFPFQRHDLGGREKVWQKLKKKHIEIANRQDRQFGEEARVDFDAVASSRPGAGGKRCIDKVMIKHA